MVNPLVASPSLPGSYELFSMKRRSTLPCLALALLLGGPGVFAAEAFCPEPAFVRASVPSITEQLKPLADLLATGEGNYNSVNRGHAGDTPGGIEYIMGRTFDHYTVADVMRMQQWHLYAVGRYQFIPSTLRFAVNASGVNMNDKFTPEVQDRLMAALIVYKRPAILSYLQGSHNNLGYALDELAREWASVEYRGGRSYYSVGGNRAHITRSQAAKVLQEIKASWQEDGVLP